MSTRLPIGLLDTSVVIDLEYAASTIGLPVTSQICSITLAELNYGVATAKTAPEAVERSRRYADFRAWLKPLPFDAKAADKYGELAALVVAAGRNPRPRRIDIMIAAVAAANNLPLYTLNGADFSDLVPVLTIVG